MPSWEELSHPSSEQTSEVCPNTGQGFCSITLITTTTQGLPLCQELESSAAFQKWSVLWVTCFTDTAGLNQQFLQGGLWKLCARWPPSYGLQTVNKGTVKRQAHCTSPETIPIPSPCQKMQTSKWIIGFVFSQPDTWYFNKVPKGHKHQPVYTSWGSSKLPRFHMKTGTVEQYQGRKIISEPHHTLNMDSFQSVPYLYYLLQFSCWFIFREAKWNSLQCIRSVSGHFSGQLSFWNIPLFPPSLGP